MLEFVEKISELYSHEFDGLDPEIKNCKDRLFLYILVRFLKPSRILEIGTSNGKNLHAIIAACIKNQNEYKIHTIDINDNLKLDNFLLEYVEVHIGHSNVILEKIKDKIDFIFSNGKIDKKSARLLNYIITPKTFFSTKDFVPPYDKGIVNLYHIVNSTILKNSKLIMPSEKSNWIYKTRSFYAMKETFSVKYIQKNKLELIDGHSIYKVNNSIAILIPEYLSKVLNLDFTKYCYGKGILSVKHPIINFRNDHIITNQGLYCYNKYDREVIVMCKFKNKLPFVYRLFGVNLKK